jgi:hypothetical protein
MRKKRNAVRGINFFHQPVTVLDESRVFVHQVFCIGGVKDRRLP